MAHGHSGMHHSVIAAATLLMVHAQSCQRDCALAELLNISRKVVPQLAAVQAGAVVLDAPPQFLDRDLESAWSLDSGPPSFPFAHTASYSILRI